MLCKNCNTEMKLVDYTLQCGEFYILVEREISGTFYYECPTCECTASQDVTAKDYPFEFDEPEWN
jgi:hypothetical protein